jgi:hypothetical protein
MKVLIACEFSGIVRQAFRNKGHDAWSCDLLPVEDKSKFHYQKDVLNILEDGWDLMISHPPCTHLAISGARWFKDKEKEQKEAIDFFMKLVNARIPKICVENPICIMSSKYRKPDQIIQPWQFGESFQKTTCLWLKNLPKLIPTKIVDKGDFHITKSGKKLPKWYNLPPSKDRWKERSRFFIGIAKAMADQWGI